MNFSQPSKAMTMLMVGALLCTCSGAPKNGQDTSQARAAADSKQEGETGCNRADLATASSIRMFAEMDADKDGKVTEAEVRGLAESRFAAADTNKDGFLDEPEVKALLEANEANVMASIGPEARQCIADMNRTWEALLGPPGQVELMAQLDTDGDGRISRAEFVDVSAGLFMLMVPVGKDVLTIDDMMEVFGNVRGMHEQGSLP